MTGSFLDEIALGRYVPGTSPLHKTAPAWKALLFSAVAVASFFFQSATSFLVLGLCLAVCSLGSGLPQKLFWRSLRPINLLALFTILTWAFINHNQASIFHPQFSWQGLHIGGLYAGRLAIITLLTTLFFLTTRPAEAIGLGIKSLAPLRLFGTSQEELSLLVHLAYRFVPLLRREIEEIALGRKARNLPPPRGAWQRAKASSSTLIYIFVGALKRAETASFTLEERRVAENWTSLGGEHSTRGFGGWCSLLILVVLGALIAWDPLLL